MDDGSGVFFVEVAVYIGALLIAAYCSSEAGKAKEEESDRLGHMVTEVLKADLLVKDRAGIASYHNDCFAIAITNELKKLVVVMGGTYTRTIYDFKNLISAEINIDGNTVSSPSYGGAIAGGILFGGAGAIIGSSHSTTKEKIKRVSLRLYSDDLHTPVHDLFFLKSSIALNNDHDEVKDALSLANEWYGRFLTIIEKNKSVNRSLHGASSSVADEISKMKKLVEEGVITQHEFDAFKKSLFK